MPAEQTASPSRRRSLVPATTYDRSIMDRLEPRRLFATVSVANFGAIPDDGKDDTAAIQAAINASRNGDFVTFQSGKYDIGNVITYEGNRAYVGVMDGTVLSRTDTWRQGQLNYYNANNVVFDGLTFEGNGLLLEGKNGATNVTVQNCNFVNMTHRANDQCNMIIINKLRDSYIINNRFENINGDNGILGYNLLGNVIIEGNVFENVHEGIHITNFNSYAKGISVSYNEFIGIRRMGVEIQENPNHIEGGFDGLLVEGNYLHDFRQAYNETFALSIVADKGTNTVIRNNVISGYTSDGAGNPWIWYGIEAAGINTIVEKNQICGSFVGISVETGANGIVRSNKLAGIVNSVYWVARHPGVRFLDNVVGGSIDCNSPPPGFRPGRGGGDPDPDQGPVDPTNGVPPILTVAPVDSARITLFWTDTSSEETGYQVEHSFDGSSWAQIAQLGPSVKSYQDKNLPAGTVVFYRVRWFIDSEVGPWSNVAAGKTRGTARPASAPSAASAKAASNDPGEEDEQEPLFGVVPLF